MSPKSILLLLTVAIPASLHAQQAAPPVTAPAPAAQADPEEADAPAGEEIVVTGQRPRGSVRGDIPPEITLDRREVRALGASSIAELIAALAPQTRSGRGRGDDGPVVLLNGRRISGFSEIRNLPPEAVDRVEILPEEVALQYGYRADQRVVNIVLRQRFRALTAEANGGLPTAGGRTSSGVDLNLLRLDRSGRWSLDAEYNHDSALLESERDIQQAINPATGLAASDARFRTLLPRVDRLRLGGTLNRAISDNIAATLDARFDATDTASLFGLPTGAAPSSADNAGSAADPLARDSRNHTGHLGLSVNGDALPWRWTFTGNLDRNSNFSLTDTDAPTALRTRDRARSIDQAIEGQALANGPLFKLPAGRVTASLRVGGTSRDFSSDSIRGTLIRSADLSRDSANAQASLDIPLTRRSSPLGAIGDLSANVNYAVDRLSDFGTLTTLGYGLNWSPIERVRLIASTTSEDGAPTVQQLGDPVIEQPNARVFDFTRGETVILTRVDGGNPNLLADHRRVLKLGLTVQPLSKADLTLTADYTRNRTRNVIAAFPAATPEIESAFPDRFTRGADGRLLRIDNRPVNFARADREELRWGFNFSKPLGKVDPAADRAAFRAGRRGGEGAAPPANTPAAPDGAARPSSGAQGRPPGAGGPARGSLGRGGFGFGGGGRGGFGGRGPGTLQVGLYHIWRFRDSILIRDGVPELDLLRGSATGNRGGSPRHQLDLQLGVFKNGLGARFTGSYQSGTTVSGLSNGLTGSTAGDLSFGAFSTFNLRLFADLGAQEKLVRRIPALRGARISLAFDNLFDQRLRVRDAAGLTPLGYQGDLLDPLGRSVRISLRKVFFPTRPPGGFRRPT